MADNPFADNPFAVTSSGNGRVPSATGAWNSSTAGAWGGGSAPSPPPAASSKFGPTPTSTTAPSGAEMKKEAELARREAELNRRETELRRLEMELRNAPGSKSVKNWPKFCPIIHHDIASEIPASLQGTIRCVYYAWVGVLVCLFVNFIGTTAWLIVNGDIAPFLWGGLYLVGGIPGSYIFWYSRVYNAAIKDSAFGYAMFFLFFIAGHLVFTGWSAVGPPILNDSSHTGILMAIEAIGDNTGLGIVYFIGAGLWIVEFLWSFWAMKKVYSAFRGQGHNMNDVKRGAVTAAIV